jgi:thymidylate kinase
MGDLEDLTKETLPKMAVAFFTVAATKLLSKDSIKSAIRGRARKLITGSAETPHQDVEAVEGFVDKIMDILDSKGISPASIGIDGPPGSGKSTLGRSLAKRTGLKWRTLYVKDMREPYYFMPGRIYENIRLFRTQNIDNFDVIIYIDCKVEDAQRRVVTRDRNAALADYVDIQKLKQIGDAAFEMADGEEMRIPMSPVRIKIKPKDGYKDIDNLRKKLRSKGFDVERFSKEELFFVYCYGKPKSGILPYVNLGAYNNEFLSAAYTALRLATAKKLLS